MNFLLTNDFQGKHVFHRNKVAYFLQSDILKTAFFSSGSIILTKSNCKEDVQLS